MPVAAVTPAPRVPRRARYLIPIQTPRRAELVAVLSTAAVLIQVVFAQLTLVLVIAFHATSRLTRWRPQWLLVPAATGLVWALAMGPAAAAARLAAGPRLVLAYLAGTGRHPGRVLHPAGAFAGLTHWLPGQFPLALVLAAIEAAGLWWLDWLHASERLSGQPRPGLLVAVRRRWTAASIRSGGVVTTDGGCVGIDAATGRPAAISWQEAEGGVLCAGPAAAEPDGTGIAETCFMLAHAGIRRRKPVIVIDLTGSGWLTESLAAGCAAAGAPLRSLGWPGPGYYEPVRSGDPAQAASLVTGMIDWSGGTDEHRRTCAAYLTDVFAVLAAAPADPRMPILDDLTGLLNPAALRARLSRVPAYYPSRAALAERVGVSVRQAAVDPAALSAPAIQLAALRASALGHWLAPGPSARAAPAGPGDRPGRGRPLRGAAQLSAAATPAAEPLRISLGQAVRDRAVVAFSLDRAVHDRSACMIASLAACDMMAVCAELRRIGVPGDALAWIHGCEAVDHRVLSDLIAAGAGAGLAVLLSTGSAAAADRLAGIANVVLARGPAGPAVAARFADFAGPADRAYQADRAYHADLAGRAYHADRAGRADSAYQADRADRADLSDRGDGADRADPAGPGAGRRRVGIPGRGTGITADYPLKLEDSRLVGADALRGASSEEFTLLVKGPRPRVLPSCRSVRGTGPGQRR